jgi:spore maturation protein CgeB
MGTADYYEEMPYIFHDSKINLNISLRSIRSGIPLRCMDILGNGGFLLSNYQSDFLRHFTPDEDFVYFENETDLLHKIDYYLSHEEERAAIAASGHDKVLKYHNFDVIFDEILSIAL